MPDRLYGTSQAPMNWLVLLDELREAQVAYRGHSELHVTNAGDRRSDGTSYPEVYHIDYVPLHWETVSREQMDKLFDIADRHEAKVTLTGRRLGRTDSGHLVARFEHR